MPITSSFPHLMYASDAVTRKLEGLDPSEEKHGSAAVIEPKQQGLPNHIYYLMYFVVKIVKPLQLYFSLALITIGTAIYLATFRKLWSSHFGSPTKTAYTPVLRFKMSDLKSSSASNS
ncbi:unnamed protein product [Nesidiocoris tenuis]|uniref:Uncharacterized protein n=1 Tax=Nesidiocoris tenuis TaxID=355587 RepID=A0A6H5HAP3_9HEMI|nr:unnamed protein product [Nesidiocoris tenuis]